MSSPWPPRVTAVTSWTETPSSQAMKAAKRAESSTPAWPTTRWCGKPVMRWQSVTIASSGLEMTMTKALGAYCLDALGDGVMIFELVRDQVVAAHARLAGQAGGDDARRRRP